jgi:hypothetical protein
MPRGGPRQGTPGKGYSNRTDLTSAPDMSKNTAASGGMEPPNLAAPGPQGPPPRSPDDSPMLSAPTARPGEPVTAGLATGPGGGPEMLNQFDTRNQEAQKLQRWLPLLKPIAEDPETPESVKILYRYIRGSA